MAPSDLEQALRTARQAASGASEREAQFQSIAAALAQATTLSEVADVFITRGAAALGTNSSTLCLLSADGQALRLVASVRMPPEVLTSFNFLPLGAEQRALTPAVEAVRAQQALWFRSNAEIAQDFPALAAARAVAGLEASAVVPVSLGARVLGVVVFAFYEAREFTGAERGFILALANQCAQALERIRLYDSERDLRLHEQDARAEAEASQQRLTFLLEVSSALAAMFDYDTLMQRVADLLVPYLADYASVYTLEPDRRITNLATAHVVPAKQARLRTLHAQVQLWLDSPHSLIAKVMRTGEALLDSHFDWQAQYEHAPAADQDYLAALQPNAHIILPLTARGHALGVIVLATSERERRLNAADLELASDVGRRVALAADNALLLRQAQQLNNELEERVQQRTSELVQSEARFHTLVDSVQDYAIFLLDPAGHIASWSTGAARIKGYTAAEIIGKHFSTFYTPEDLQRGVPEHGLQQARDTGRWEAEGWRVRRDGTRFWANVVITSVRNPAGELLGFAKVTRDLTERKSLEDRLRNSRELLVQEIAARRQVQQQLEQAREAERARIAREVHDELGGALTGLKMGLRRLHNQTNLPEGTLAKLDELSAEIDATVQVVRRIAHELRPAVLDDFGLLAALEWQFGEFKRRSGLEAEWHAELDDLDLPNEVAIACFRIFQEALTNVARHAQATKVDGAVRLEGDTLIIRLADNGRGLPPDGRVEPGHLGLVGMRERATHLSGELDIDSAPGQGTTVTLRVPVRLGA